MKERKKEIKERKQNKGVTQIIDIMDIDLARIPPAWF